MGQDRALVAIALGLAVLYAAVGFFFPAAEAGLDWQWSEVSTATKVAFIWLQVQSVFCSLFAWVLTVLEA